jgi:hypothetical protein
LILSIEPFANDWFNSLGTAVGVQKLKSTDSMKSHDSCNEKFSVKMLRTAVLMVLFVSASLAADFSRSQLTAHPLYPADGPFILEISGTWPTDCHPGEQLPFVRSFDGQTLEIEYEIVLAHVICNDFETDFRSLVDVSEAIRQQPALSGAIDVRVDYVGALLEQSLALDCPSSQLCDASAVRQLLPERGLYVTPDRTSEGLLVARQNEVTAIYPLVYDENGSAEWLLGVARIPEDSFFASLNRWEGGACFDCPPGGEEAQKSPVGSLSALVDRADTLQVKLNDRPFTTYRKLVYGYRSFLPGAPGSERLTGLEGRWALSENEGTDPPLGDLTRFLPPAFDVSFEKAEPSGGPSNYISYLVQSVTGAELGQLVCAGEVRDDDGRPVCDFIDPTDQAEPLLRFYRDGPGSMSIEFGRAVIAIGTPPRGKAVRID